MAHIRSLPKQPTCFKQNGVCNTETNSSTNDAKLNQHYQNKPKQFSHHTDTGHIHFLPVRKEGNRRGDRTLTKLPSRSPQSLPTKEAGLDKDEKSRVRGRAVDPSSLSSLMWDEGFGDYVPRPSVPQPKVYIRAVFLKIGEIDTLKELFHAEVFVQARWREPALDHCHTVEEIQWHTLWNPQLHLENAIDEKSAKVWHDLSINEHGEAYVLEKRRVKADFNESLELQSFPFDVQHLSVLITSRLSDSCLELVEDESELSCVNLLTFVDRQEWDVRDIVELIPEIRSREFSVVKHKFPMITVRTYAMRRAGFFVWNVLAIMVLISSLMLCTFAVPRTLVQNRLQLTFTLVLTGVAFKFVVVRSLPKISYLTVLDRYILGSMIIMHVVGVWHAIIYRIDSANTDLGSEMDKWAFIIFILLFSVFNIGFAIAIVYKTYRKRKYVTNLELVYQIKAQRLDRIIEETVSQMNSARKSRVLYNNSRVHTL